MNGQITAPREWYGLLHEGLPLTPGQVEFRLKRPSGGGMESVWMPWPANSGGNQSLWPEGISQDRHAYFGIAQRRDTSSGTRDNCLPTPLQWVDLDLKDAPSYTGGLTKDALLETDSAELREYKAALFADLLTACERLKLPPRAVVDSGHGLQVYWTRHTAPDDSAETEEVNRALAAALVHLGADAKVHDLPRILRLPGSVNLKNPARPLPVEVWFSEPDAWVEREALNALPRVKAAAPLPSLVKPAPVLPQVGSGAPAERYVNRAVDEECAAVASAGEGGRNDALNRAAFSLGTLVGAGVLDEQHAAQVLTAAGEAAGLEAGEIRDTVRSGLSGGKAKPRDLSRVGQRDAGEAAGVDVEGELLTWSERQPLPAGLPDVPTLPPEMLPAALRGWLVDLAELACVPLEGLAASALAGLSGLIGRSVQLAPEGLDNSWRVVPNLWGALVMRPSGLKSMQLDAALSPLRELENRAREEFEAGEVDRELKMEALKMQEEQIKRDSKKSGRLDLDALRELRMEAREAAPTPQRYMVQNTTYEKLGELLRENPLGLTMVRDELSGWIEAMGREENSEPRSFWLQTWNGDGSYTFDRIGRGTVRVDNLCVAVMGAIQPGPLQRFVSKSRAAGADDVGFLQRFQLLVYPDGLPTWKRPSRRADDAAKAQALAVFEALDTVRQSAEPVTLTFSAEAQVMFMEWRDALEVRLRGGELAQFPAFESHLGKYRSLAPSLALIFHLVDVAAPSLHPAGLPPVTAQALDLALNWTEFLELHARKVYAHDLGTAYTPALALAEKITGSAVRDGDRLRDLRRKGWAGLSDEELGAAVQALSDLGWVQVEKRKTSGRPVEVLRLHPDFLPDGGGEV